ncbi:uncharacterized protein FTOL_03113 [Fusarium torulosum]|uniref:Prion-inhibition and propagation HeLo domain-containing protein n=1 Tax=Fusarium torulosum TaxID=33205 RepID=A0AAE8M3A2_9HYPO|nr:uncharacterized protein FTOL_03113 [Fusarium torulosum]
MEHFGYKIALAGLFQECVDVVERTQPHQALNTASLLLETRFLIAKDLFKQWGSKVGLAAETLPKAAVDDRFDHKTAANVKEVLDIVNSLCDCDNPYLPVCSIFDTVLRGATGKCAPKNERKRNLKWMFRDKKNQSDHVKLFEMIVQRLHELVPVEISTTHTRSKGSAHTAIVEMERIMARIENAPQDGQEEILPWVSRELGLDEVVDHLLRDNNLSSDEEQDLEDKALTALFPGRHDLLRMLIDGGVDLRLGDSNNWTLLHHAVWFDFTESVELLIERGADVEAKTRMGNTALHLAQSAEAVETLVKMEANLDALNCKGETPLISACVNGLVDVPEQLVDEGTTLTPQDNHKRTALHSACWGGYYEVVLLCLQGEAEVEVYDEDEETPMHLACFIGHADIVHLLIEAAADTETKDSYGRAPLNRACYDGFEDVAEVLLEADCDVDTTGPGNRTALHVAVRKGHLGIVKLLAERGANLTALDDEGFAPLHAAAGCGYLEIAKVLLDAGADVMIRGRKD